MLAALPTRARPVSDDALHAEARLIRPLLRRPPWEQRRGDETHTDTGMRALFRRALPEDETDLSRRTLLIEATHDALASLGFRPDGLDDGTPAFDRAVDHAAVLLHLVARSEGGGTVGFGEACRRAKVSDARFPRLMHTPPHGRAVMLSRLAQQFRRSGVKPLWAAPSGQGRQQTQPYQLRNTRGKVEGEDGATGYAVLDEVLPLLVYLYGYGPERVVARWASGFYDSRPKKNADAEDPTPEPAPAA